MGVVIASYYVELIPEVSFPVFQAAACALGEVILPVGIVLLFVVWLPESQWMIVKVASLILATAPFSSLLGLAVAVLFLPEGP